MPAALKLALEDLLRTRQLTPAFPALDEGRRLTPLATGVAAVDALLAGGFPRGQVSEVSGAASSGRMGLALGALARITRQGAWGAWVDPQDCLDPTSAAAGGVELERLLWLRGAALKECLAALGTLLGSGLFELVILDLVPVARGELLRVPHTTWIRLRRLIEGTPTALLILTAVPIAESQRGAVLRLRQGVPDWSGGQGGGRFLRALRSEAAVTERRHPSPAIFERLAYP
jgi:hypothetical protein